jgi:hypothetical protein
MHWINTSLNNNKIPEVITAKCFHKCHNNKQFIPRVYMLINHKMTHRYIYFRFTRHALQLHHVTMLNYLHGYKRLCCQNLAHRQPEIRWSFFVEHLNLWFAGTHENHENWYTTNKNEFTVYTCHVILAHIFVSMNNWAQPCIRFFLSPPSPPQKKRKRKNTMDFNFAIIFSVQKLHSFRI